MNQQKKSLFYTILVTGHLSSSALEIETDITFFVRQVQSKRQTLDYAETFTEPIQLFADVLDEEFDISKTNS